MTRVAAGVMQFARQRLIRPTAVGGLLPFIFAATAVLSAGSGRSLAQMTTTPSTSSSPTTTQASAPTETAAGSPTALELVVQIVSPETPQAALADAITLVNMAEQDPKAIEAVMTIIDNKNNHAAKIAACHAIARGKSAQPAYKTPLLKMIKSTEPALQNAADAALANYADDDAKAARESYRLQHERSLLVQALKRNMAERYALTSEVERPTLLLEWLAAPLAIQQLVALEYVHDAPRAGKLPQPAVLAEVRTLLNGTDPEVLRKAILVLRDCRLVEDAPRIEALLKTPRPEAVREAIYNALGKLNNPGAFAACVTGLSDPSELVAAEAAKALGSLALSPEPLTESMRNEAVKALLGRSNAEMKEPTLRERIFDAMAAIGDDSFLEVLAKHVGDDEASPTVRQSAIRAIGRIDGVGHIDLLNGRLKDSDAGVRKVASQTILTVFKTLAAAGDESAAYALLEKAIDETPPNQTDLQAGLATVLIETYLSNPDFDKALARAASLPPGTRAAVATVFYQFVSELAKSDAAASLAFMDKLKLKVPDLFGNGWSVRFSELDKTLRPTTRPAEETPSGGASSTVIAAPIMTTVSAPAATTAPGH